jgi:hypothetical protein
MNLLRAVALAETLFSAGRATTNVAPPPKNRAVQCFLALSVLLGAVSFVFFMIALNTWLQTSYSKEASALITALVSLGTALLLALCATAGSLYRQARMMRIKQVVRRNAMNFFQSAAKEMDDPIRNHPGLSAALATIIGFLVAKKIL